MYRKCRKEAIQIPTIKKYFLKKKKVRYYHKSYQTRGDISPRSSLSFHLGFMLQDNSNQHYSYHRPDSYYCKWIFYSALARRLSWLEIIPHTRKVVGLLPRSSGAISVESLLWQDTPAYDMWPDGGMCPPLSLMFSGRGLLRLMVTRRHLKPIYSLLWSLLQMLSVDPVLCATLCATLNNGFWKMPMSQYPTPVNMLPCLTKGTLHMCDYVEDLEIIRLP